MTKLRLGPIVDEKPVKLTIEMAGALHRQLQHYARAHAEENGLESPLPIERMVAPMLERFIEGDRAFGRRKRSENTTGSR